VGGVIEEPTAGLAGFQGGDRENGKGNPDSCTWRFSEGGGAEKRSPKETEKVLDEGNRRRGGWFQLESGWA